MSTSLGLVLAGSVLIIVAFSGILKGNYEVSVGSKFARGILGFIGVILLTLGIIGAVQEINIPFIQGSATENGLLEPTNTSDNVVLTNPTAIIGSDPTELFTPVALPSSTQVPLNVEVNSFPHQFVCPNELEPQAVVYSYTSDFEGLADIEWSHQITDKTPSTAQAERTFLGQLGTDNVNLVLSSLPEHTTGRLSFELFIIRSWDGDDPRGPDIWEIAVDGQTLLQTTFDNENPLEPEGHSQSFPNQYIPGAGGSQKPRTGSTENNTLGYRFLGEPMDAVYKFCFEFPHLADTLTVQFAAQGIDEVSAGDESWGIDNVTLQLANVPSLVNCPAMVQDETRTVPPNTFITGDLVINDDVYYDDGGIKEVTVAYFEREAKIYTPEGGAGCYEGGVTSWREVMKEQFETGCRDGNQLGCNRVRMVFFYSDGNEVTECYSSPSGSPEELQTDGFQTHCP